MTWSTTPSAVRTTTSPASAARSAPADRPRNPSSRGTPYRNRAIRRGVWGRWRFIGYPGSSYARSLEDIEHEPAPGLEVVRDCPHVASRGKATGQLVDLTDRN